MHDKQQLIKDLRDLGVQPGMVLFLHSSFKSLQFQGTPEEVIEAFQEVLTPEGTLLLPTLTYKSVTKDNPHFSYHDSVSCVGILPEVFRKMKGVVRSMNPIHSVAAWGRHALYLTSAHIEDDITLGNNSPYARMLSFDAKICMLGCGLKPNTFMHYVENINRVPYREVSSIIPMHLTDADGRTFLKEIHMPDMRMYVQRYDRITQVLSENEMHSRNVLSADAFFIDANSLLQKASIALKKDPFFFVDPL